MLKNWPKNLWTKGKTKQQMIKYWCFVWTQGPILKLAVFWPKSGSNNDWVFQLLIKYINGKSPKSEQETEYALCWRQRLMVLLKFRKGGKTKSKDTSS
jgi:hypothetical protein